MHHCFNTIFDYFLTKNKELIDVRVALMQKKPLFCTIGE